MSRRSGVREGMILVNVLFVCALAAAVVMLMINAQSVSVDRTVRLTEAAQASAWAKAGETSAIAALRRDRRDAPDVDHPAEPWSRVVDTRVPIEGGAFSLAIEDDQARFNLNAARRGGPAARARLEAIAALARLDAGDIAAVLRAVEVGPPLGALEDLIARGVAAEVVGRLQPYLTVLPARATVNVNTADPALLALMLNNPSRAARIVEMRRRGPVDTATLRREEIVLPTGLGVASDHFTVVTTVDIGSTRQVLTSRLSREGRGERARVRVWRRDRSGGVSPP